MEVVAPIRTARTQAPSVMLRDALARPLVSLRLSVTDRCNLRCMYCMPEKHYQWLPQDHLLSSEELVRLVDIFTVFGVRRLRLTGGEPLLLRDLDGLVTLLAANPLIEDLALTTNGILLAEQAGALHRAGLHRVTISLDTLRPERFLAITRRDEHARVLDGIAAARREVLQRYHFAHPLPLRFGRKAAPHGARRYVLVHGGSRGQHRTLADGDVRDDARARSEHDEILDRHAAAEAGLRDNDAMAADDTIVSNLTEIIDLGSFADHGIAHSFGFSGLNPSVAYGIPPHNDCRPI